MSKPLTGMDRQRVDFVESLHNSLKKQATQALADHKKYIKLATTYMQDGLEESECIELLMIDGLSREASESYTAMATSKENDEIAQAEYSFQFEDSYGKVYSSYDIGKTIHASTDEEAWNKAEEIIDEETEIEPQKIISVTRVD